MEKSKAPKGTKDIFSPDIEKWQFLEDKIKDIFNRFYFTEIRTPVFEHTELFSRLGVLCIREYPPKISSAPEPVKTTFFFEFFEAK